MLHLLNAFFLVLLINLLINPLLLCLLLKLLPLYMLLTLMRILTIATLRFLVFDSLLCRLVNQLFAIPNRLPLLSKILFINNLTINFNNFLITILFSLSFLHCLPRFLHEIFCIVFFVIYRNRFSLIITHLWNRFRTVATILFSVTDSLVRLILQLLLFWSCLLVRRIIRLLFPPLFLKFLLLNLVLLRNFWGQCLSLHSCHETRTEF